MMRVAVIPARGGSKRILRKNERHFLGRPMMAYSIEAALQSKLFDRVIVSTEDENIAALATACGAEVPFRRPESLADDFTGIKSVVKHALNWLVSHGEKPAYVCCICATAPFLTPGVLQEGWIRLEETGKSFAFSVTSFPCPVQRALRVTPEGVLEAIFPDKFLCRSQDLGESYQDAAQFYWGKYEAFVSEDPTFLVDAVPVILPRYRVQDIDTPEDWCQAEAMFESLSKMGLLS